MAETEAKVAPPANNLERINDVKVRYESELLKKANVVAVGIGIPIRNGQPAGEVGIIVSVTHKVAAMELAVQDLIPRELEGVRVWVEEVGRPHAGNDAEPAVD